MRFLFPLEPPFRTTIAAGIAIAAIAVTPAASATPPLPPNGATCSAPTDCASGFCVDGVCCNSVCAGACAACDLPGLLGTCSPVVGAPHGTRAPCDARASNDCAKTTCDGTTTTACTGFANGNTMRCGTDSCSADAALKASACDGRGGCVATKPMSCAPFACSGTACATSCVRASDCAAGYACDAATRGCVVSAATCNSDRTKIIRADGVTTDCAPFRCSGDVCLAICNDDSSCVSGYTCNASTRSCLAPGAPTGPLNSGCSVSTTTRSHGADRRAGLVPAAAVMAIGAIVARRRRLPAR